MNPLPIPLSLGNRSTLDRSRKSLIAVAWQDKVTSTAIQAAVTDKIALNYQSWQTARGAALSGTEELLGQAAGALDLVAARRRAPAPPPAPPSTTTCTGTDWSLPSGLGYISTAEEGIVVAAMTAALSANGLASNPSAMKANQPSPHRPALA
jgi:hypothetical protein